MNTKTYGLIIVSGLVMLGINRYDTLYSRPHYNDGARQREWLEIFNSPSQYKGGDITSVYYPWTISSDHPTSLGRHNWMPRQSTFPNEASVYTSESQFRTRDDFDYYSSHGYNPRNKSVELPTNQRSINFYKLD